MTKRRTIASAPWPLEAYTSQFDVLFDRAISGKPSVIRLIGSLEICGALGLIVPKATNCLPWLTPVAAIGLVLTMMGAILTIAIGCLLLFWHWRCSMDRSARLM